jgi:hypothetical protein
MLKTNKDSFSTPKFEEIILHYLDMSKATLAKKAPQISFGTTS